MKVEYYSARNESTELVCEFKFQQFISMDEFELYNTAKPPEVIGYYNQRRNQIEVLFGSSKSKEIGFCDVFVKAIFDQKQNQIDEYDQIIISDKDCKLTYYRKYNMDGSKKDILPEIIKNDDLMLLLNARI